MHLQAHALKKSTVGGYSTGAHDYLCFCCLHQLPLEPTPQTLSRYIAYTSLSIGSGPKYLTGVCHFLHDFYPDFDFNCFSPLVQATIRGSKKTRADPVHRKQPLRISHISAFLDTARRTQDYDDLLFITIMSCCFYGCHHSGELVLKSKKNVDWQKIIKHSSLHFSGGYAGYRLPYHKTDPFYRGTDILFSSQDVADPVAFSKNLLKLGMRFMAPADLFLFAKMAPIPLACGLIPNSSPSLTGPLVDTHFTLAEPHSMLLLTSLRLSLWLLAIGPQRLGKFIRDNPCVRAALQLAVLHCPLR